ncbi:MAG TPA: RdgB/HAM1 family non-canonical purine NTP pyrophosphatase [Candidatus Acidoferrales bacterium]|nr:RdgB/HAM1 family non-canonical purine NTP pyrophosphatase [Candidatus Acidoferrales bacterium]
MRVKLLLASSNPGKLNEFRAMAASLECAREIELELLPGFDTLPRFAENAPTFAENAAGKALHYSQRADGVIVADDSGLVVRALGGAPGVRSARYAGENATDAERNSKLLAELRGKTGDARNAKFVCVIAAAKGGTALAVVSECVEGVITEMPRGTGGFGYDPIFYFSPMQKTFAELSPSEKNDVSHRGKAFRKLCAALA